MSDLKWSGKSKFRSREPTIPSNSNLWMLAEDAGTKIWLQCVGPARGHKTRRGAVTFRFEPESEQVARFAAQLVSENHPSEFQQGFASFANMIARTIITDGGFAYELEFGRASALSGIQRIRFSPIFTPGGCVSQWGKDIVQVIRPDIATEIGCGRRVRLDAADVFIFGSPRRWKRALRSARRATTLFQYLEDKRMQEVTESLGTGAATGDFKTFLRSNCAMLARETSLLGWQGRGLFSGLMGDYQLIDRTFRWEEFCADLRDEILRVLGNAIQRIAEELGAPCELVVLRNEQEEPVNQLRDRFRKGEIPIPEILKVLFPRS